MEKFKHKYQQFSMNKSLSLRNIFIKMVFLFFSLVIIIYLTVSIGRIYLTFSGDLIEQEKMWKFIRLISGFIFTLILSTAMFLIFLLSTFKNRNEIKLISNLLQNSIIPIIALATLFLGVNKIGIIKDSILLTEIAKEAYADKDLFNNIMQGSIFFIAPSILTIVYNVKVFLLKVSELKNTSNKEEIKN